MTQAGSKGFDVTMTTFSTPTDFTAMAALIKNDLSQIGINVSIVPQDPVTFGANNSAGDVRLGSHGSRHARRRRRLRGRVQPERRGLLRSGSRAGTALRRARTRSRSGASSATAGSRSTRRSGMPMYQKLDKDLIDEQRRDRARLGLEVLRRQQAAEEHLRRVHRLQPGAAHGLHRQLADASSRRRAGSAPAHRSAFAPMYRFVAERLAALFATLVAVSIIIFVLVRLAARQHPRPLLRRATTRRRPSRSRRRRSSSASTGSYLEQYWRWVSGAVHGDFGHSLLTAAARVRTSCRPSLPIDIELILLGIADRAARSASRSARSRPSGATAPSTTSRASPACRDQHPELLARDAAADLHVARLPLGAAARVRPVLRGPVARTSRSSSCRRSRSPSSRSRS